MASVGPESTPTNEDVVDAPERPVGVEDERVVRRERRAVLTRVGALPGVPVADAVPVERLAAGPEADARGTGVGVHVACHDDVPAIARECFDCASGGDGLPLSLELEARLPAREMVDEDQRAERCRGVDFGQERATFE